MSLESGKMYQQNYQDRFYTACIGPYREKVTWRYLPPAIQPYRADPINAYLDHLDKLMEGLKIYDQDNKQAGSDDIIDIVFANQSAQHRIQSTHLASLIVERKKLAEVHEKELDSRLMEFSGARSLARMLNPPDGGRRMASIERQILDMEKQKRDVRLRLWKDTLQLRDKLLTERNEYTASGRRIKLLSGDSYG